MAQKTKIRKQGPRKTAAFSFFAVMIGLSLIEGASRLVSQTGTFDYVEERFAEQGLDQHKRRDEFRIFLYGESTIHGSHLYTKSTIKKWIEFYLEDLLGKEISRRVTVINLGRVGYDSRFISQSFIDTVVHKPDLAVVYSVHNDFIFPENREAHLKEPSFKERLSLFFKDAVKKSAFLTIIRRASVKVKLARRAKRQAENVPEDRWYDETKRRQHNPADIFVPGSDQFRAVEAKWQANIFRMARTAQLNRIPIVFLNRLARIKDYEPFESVHAKDLTQEQLAAWERLNERAQDKFDKRLYDEALVLFMDLLKLDGQYALTYFRIGQCLEKLGKHEEAYDYFESANDLDHIPNRAPSAVNRFYAELQDQKLPFVEVMDMARVFESRSPNGFIDRKYIVDQMHPTIEGQALIALEIVKMIFEKGMIAPPEEWDWKSLRTVEEMVLRLELTPAFEFEHFMYSANFVGSYHEHAIEYLQRALAIKPGSAAARSQLAWVYWISGEKESALKEYRILAGQVPDLAEVFFNRHPEIAEALNSWHP